MLLKQLRILKYRGRPKNVYFYAQNFCFCWFSNQQKVKISLCLTLFQNKSCSYFSTLNRLNVFSVDVGRLWNILMSHGFEYRAFRCSEDVFYLKDVFWQEMSLKRPMSMSSLVPLSRIFLSNTLNEKYMKLYLCCIKTSFFKAKMIVYLENWVEPVALHKNSSWKENF